MGIALRLTRQCRDNGLVKYWSKKVQETWVCELSPLNNCNIVDTAKNQKQANKLNECKGQLYENKMA